MVSTNFLTQKTSGKKKYFLKFLASRNVFKKREFCQFLASKVSEKYGIASAYSVTFVSQKTLTCLQWYLPQPAYNQGVWPRFFLASCMDFHQHLWQTRPRMSRCYKHKDPSPVLCNRWWTRVLDTAPPCMTTEYSLLLDTIIVNVVGIFLSVNSCRRETAVRGTSWNIRSSAAIFILSIHLIHITDYERSSPGMVIPWLEQFF